MPGARCKVCLPALPCGKKKSKKEKSLSFDSDSNNDVSFSKDDSSDSGHKVARKHKKQRNSSSKICVVSNGNCCGRKSRSQKRSRSSSIDNASFSTSGKCNKNKRCTVLCGSSALSFNVDMIPGAGSIISSPLSICPQAPTVQQAFVSKVCNGTIAVTGRLAKTVSFGVSTSGLSCTINTLCALSDPFTVLIDDCSIRESDCFKVVSSTVCAISGPCTTVSTVGTVSTFFISETDLVRVCVARVNSFGCPRIDDVCPSILPAGGFFACGQVLTITGSNFNVGQVTLLGVCLTICNQSACQIQVQVTSDAVATALAIIAATGSLPSACLLIFNSCGASASRELFSCAC